ncbi:MAG TPA: hypothetical protein VGN80_19160 [Devosiaceae bacterium]|jgi:hypothetical protein|nr:hypothetical protein [Devosiaceae bacterium]
MVRLFSRMTILVVSSLLLTLGALAPAAAAATFLPDFPYPAAIAFADDALALDRLGHQLQLEGVEPESSATVAFGERALAHPRYSNGHFGGVDLQLQM